MSDDIELQLKARFHQDVMRALKVMLTEGSHGEIVTMKRKMDGGLAIIKIEGVNDLIEIGSNILEYDFILVDGSAPDGFNFKWTFYPKSLESHIVYESYLATDPGLNKDYLQVLGVLQTESKAEDWAVKHRQAEKLLSRVDALAKMNGSLVGRIVTEPVADGAAWYLVTADNGIAVRLQHIPLWDAWTFRDYGEDVLLDSEYIKAIIAKRDNMNALFQSSPSP